MTKNITAGSAIALIVTLFLAVTVIINVLAPVWRADLTENNLYTLSDGSKNVLSNLAEPVSLYYFFSTEAAQGLPHIQSYGQRVQEVLQEFAAQANGKLNLQIIDPEPFSEAEDKASGFGLTGVPVNGANLFFGLAATNSVGDETTIGFFQNEKEAFLEYELTKLIYQLAHPEKTKIGVISSLPVAGGPNNAPPWMIYSQLQEFFEVENLGADVSNIADDINVLIVVHPKAMLDSTLYAIDQFMMSGRAVLAFVDPFAERDVADDLGIASIRSSDLNNLTQAWAGLNTPISTVVGDRANALRVQVNPQRPPVSHVGLISLTPEFFNTDQPLMQEVASINLGSTGYVQQQSRAGITVIPLMESSLEAQTFSASRFSTLPDPAVLLDGFTPTGEVYSFAVRASGVMTSAYPDGPPNEVAALPAGHLKQSATAGQLLLVADTDILSDRLWVQVQEFMGQRMATPWAANADFLVSAVDGLSGSDALLGISSRAGHNRPFELVDELRKNAEGQFREKEQELQTELQAAEAKLAALQTEVGADGSLQLSAEQQATIVQFQQDQSRVRKELREVRHELDKDIDRLGTLLKVINIAAVPFLLLGFAMLMASRRKRKMEACKA